jgi:L-ascorbate metabolism protein UlaG (beta-lactamase superfamily)
MWPGLLIRAIFWADGGSALMKVLRQFVLGSAAFATFVLGAERGAAFERVQAKPTPSDMTENCPGLVASPRRPIAPASLRLAALANDQVRITYIGHSTFLLESPRLVRIATDYNDYVKPPVLPDVVTMNRAHSTHYTDSPEAGIAHVLRGWASEYGRPARHDAQIRDVRVRNVPTNLRDFGGGTQQHGNSIFVFEVANLCIAHLGHLHHTLTAQQVNEIGRLDAVMVPVDGGATLDLDGMMEVLDSLKAPIVIPMHYFSVFTLNRFLDRMRDKFDIEMNETPSIVLSKSTLPSKPKVVVLPGR